MSASAEGNATHLQAEERQIAKTFLLEQLHACCLPCRPDDEQPFSYHTGIRASGVILLVGGYPDQVGGQGKHDAFNLKMPSAAFVYEGDHTGGSINFCGERGVNGAAIGHAQDAAANEGFYPNRQFLNSGERNAVRALCITNHNQFNTSTFAEG